METATPARRSEPAKRITASSRGVLPPGALLYAFRTIIRIPNRIGQR